MSFEQIPTPSRIATRGGLAVYGPGTDGNVTVVGNVSLTRDMYYNNLTVLANAQIDTNGYRVFVKDTLHMADPTSVIGRLANTTSLGTLMGGAPAGVKASDTLGGNGGLNPGENFFGEAEFYNFSQAIAGYKFDAVNSTIKFLMGGSGGQSGSAGVAGTSGTGNAGNAGQSGSAGSPGSRPGFENVVGASGGMGYTGSPGNPGNPGIGGAGGAAGAGGLGGAGGGVVIISARTITGYGVIRADGNSPGLPGSGAPGSPGTPGNPGNTGSPGAAAPDFFQAAYNYIVSNAYNYNILYNFVNPDTPAANYGITPGNIYVTGYGYNPVGTYVYNYYNYQAPAANFGFVPSSFTPGNPTPATPGNPTPATPGTVGPPSVRIRAPRPNPPNPPRPNPPNPSTFKAAYYNTYNFFTPASAPQPTLVPNNIFANTAFFPPTTNTYNYVIAGNPDSAYYAAFAPQVNALEPSVFHAGGAGGAGGLGGTGGTATAGLPGSPGTSGYAGGGGVVLLISSDTPPENITVRAAAGTGDGGLATSGTVIIIKNEEPA